MSGSDRVRAFFALEIPPALKEELKAEQERLRAGLPRARWVRIEGLHLTVKFLGEVARATLDELSSELAPQLSPLEPVDVHLAGAGFFPSLRRPRVAWIGGSADRVGPVVEAVEEVAARHGLERERRPWSLHLTLARLRRPWPPPAVDAFIQWGRDVRLEPFTCSEVVLFESVLQPTGAVYTALARMPLAAQVGGGR